MGYHAMQQVLINARHLTKKQHIILMAMADACLDYDTDKTGEPILDSRGNQVTPGIYSRNKDHLLLLLHDHRDPDFDNKRDERMKDIGKTISSLVKAGLLKRRESRAFPGRQQTYEVTVWTDRIVLGDGAASAPRSRQNDASRERMRAKRAAEKAAGPAPEPVREPNPATPLVPTARVTISDRDDRRLYRQLEDVTLKLEEAREQRARYDNDREWVRGLLGSERISGPREADKLIARLEAKENGLRIALGKERAS